MPDVATIRAGVVTQGTTAAVALADNAKRMAAVLDALKRAGVAPRDNRTASVSLSPQYRYADGQAAGRHRLSGEQQRLDPFPRHRQGGRDSGCAVTEGANQIDGPTLSIDQPEAALDEARARRGERARTRAELYAKAAGLTVSRIVSISEAGQNARQPQQPIMFSNRAMAAGADSTRVVPGEAEVTAR